jgi:hypothetical protein
MIEGAERRAPNTVRAPDRDQEGKEPAFLKKRSKRLLCLRKLNVASYSLQIYRRMGKRSVTHHVAVNRC